MQTLGSGVVIGDCLRDGSEITRDHGLQLERQGSSESVQARSSAGPLTL